MQLQQCNDSDTLYIEKLKEELIKHKTNLQILYEERELIVKINEELSISNHIKDNELLNLKSERKLTDDYKYVVEMNVSLENKLKSYENKINSLMIQLEKEDCYENEVKHSSFSNSLLSSKEFNSKTLGQNEYNIILEKYLKNKEKKKIFIKANDSLKEKIKDLSTQVQSDHYLILHLQNKLKIHDKNTTEKQ